MKRTIVVWLLAVFLFMTTNTPMANAGHKVERIRPSLKSLDLKSTPTVNDLMAAGQLGGQLYPTKEVKKDKKRARHNREFGLAIDKWNRHEYKKAVKLFREYVRNNPGSPWTDEALLHVGCDARYNGRYDEAEANFRTIIEKNESSEYDGAKHMVTKAKTRLGVLKVLQNDFTEAKAQFREVKKNGSTWRERTYASYWIQRISRFEGDQKALLRCGVQALAAVMEKEGNKKAARHIAQIRPDSLKGHSLLSLKEIAANNGLTLAPRRLQTSDLDKIVFPAIVQIDAKSSTGTGHYWVLEKVQGKDLSLFDPQSGRRLTQSLKEFDAQWGGVILLKTQGNKSLPGREMSSSEMADLFGGCCGARRGESGLGGREGMMLGSGNSCNGPFGSPVWRVNMVNMNLYVNDVPIWYQPPIGPEVRFGLSYNSHATTAYNEPFGNKWQFIYSTYLVVDTGGNVTIFMPDGRRDIYVPDGSGGYTQPYKVHNRLTKIAENHFELRFPDDTVYIYDIPSGTGSLQPFLVEIRDVNNLSLTFGYNSSAQLTTITDAQGKVSALTYNAQGLVSQVADPFGRSALFEYDVDRNLTKITDMGGYWFNFTYDQDVYLTGIENEKGLVQFWIEPADGVTANGDNYPPPGDDMWENYRITVTYPEGEKEEFMYYGGCGTYGCSGYGWHVKPSHYITWESQQINNYRVDTPKTYYLPTTVANGQRDEIYKIIYPDNSFVQYGFDSVSGDVTSISDSSGATVQYTYNSIGKVASITDVRGNVTALTYAPNDVDVTAIQNDFGTVSFTYDEKHHVISVTDRLDISTSYDYNSYGQLISITDSADGVTSLTYDGNHELISVSKANQSLFEYTRDSIGRAASKTDPSGLTLLYTYSDLNQVTSVTYPDDKSIQYQLSGCCPWRVDSITDRSGRTTIFEYDSRNYKTAVIRPDGSRIRYVYDTSRNLVELLDSNNYSTRFEYDGNDRLVKKIFADGRVIVLSYDSNGRLSARTNARGIKTTYHYDSYNNLALISYSDGTPTVTYNYDIYNRLKSASGGIGQYSYTYDVESRIESVDGPWENDTLTYHYDDLGRLDGVAPQMGQAIGLQFDNINRIQRITAGPNQFGYTYKSGSSYLLDTLNRPNGSRTTYQYDGLNRLTAILNSTASGQVINQFDYAYNAEDLKESETITNGEPMTGLQQGVTAYQHNNLNQVTSAIDPACAYAYDADGNMTQGCTPDGYVFTASYDAENRLKDISYLDGSSVAQKTEFVYDLNSFIGAIRYYTNGELIHERRILRNGALALQERDADNQILREYTWGMGIGGGIGGLLALQQGGQNYSMLYDGKGNVASALDSAQMVVASYRYDAFGNLVGQSGTLDQPFRFSTKRYFEELGLSYYGYRFYYSQQGRWLNRDPLGEAGGINLYGFVANNPINLIDPFGLTWEDVLKAKRVLKKYHSDMYKENAKITFEDLPSDTLGRTTIWEGDIQLSRSEYSGELDASKKIDLLETLAHEYLHSRDTSLQRLIDSNKLFITEHHLEIYRKSQNLKRDAYDAMVNDNDEMVKDKSSCQ